MHELTFQKPSSTEFCTPVCLHCSRFQGTLQTPTKQPNLETVLERILTSDLHQGIGFDTAVIIFIVAP